MGDIELIKEIVDNNNYTAFKELIDRYQRLVITTCKGFVSSYADAEDIAQDVFIELFESLPEFRHESKLSTWIYRIAVNKSLNFIRKKKREVLMSNFFGTSKSGQFNRNDETERTDNADYQIDFREQKNALKMAINKLPENQRIAFILAKYQDLTYNEISEVMGVSLPSVESLLFRAKVNLQKYLKNFRKADS